MDRLEDGLKSKESTLKWCLTRQETGFNGRPNKKVDTCYSFWIGASISVFFFFFKKKRSSFI